MARARAPGDAARGRGSADPRAPPRRSSSARTRARRWSSASRAPSVRPVAAEHGHALDGVEVVEPGSRRGTRVETPRRALSRGPAGGEAGGRATTSPGRPLFHGALSVRAGPRRRPGGRRRATRPRKVIEAGLMGIGTARRHRHAVELLRHAGAGCARMRPRGAHPRLRRLRGQRGAGLRRRWRDIAVASARSARALLGLEPRVALLSFSHPRQRAAMPTRAERVAAALALVREREPAISWSTASCRRTPRWSPAVATTQGRGATTPVGGARERPRLPRPRRGQHRLQAHPVPRRCARHRPRAAGIRAGP